MQKFFLSSKQITKNCSNFMTASLQSYLETVFLFENQLLVYELIFFKTYLVPNRKIFKTGLDEGPLWYASVIFSMRDNNEVHQISGKDVYTNQLNLNTS